MGTNCNCAPLLVDQTLYLYEADLIQLLLKKNEKKLAQSINSTFRYIEGVLSQTNSKYGDFVYHIYPVELEIEDTTYKARSTSYLDLSLEKEKIIYVRAQFVFSYFSSPRGI